MHVCTTGFSQTAFTVSDSPFSPSQTTSTSNVPRFLISEQTRSQYLASHRSLTTSGWMCTRTPFPLPSSVPTTRWTWRGSSTTRIGCAASSAVWAPAS